MCTNILLQVKGSVSIFCLHIFANNMKIYSEKKFKLQKSLWILGRIQPRITMILIYDNFLLFLKLKKFKKKIVFIRLCILEVSTAFIETVNNGGYHSDDRFFLRIDESNLCIRFIDFQNSGHERDNRNGGYDLDRYLRNLSFL